MKVSVLIILVSFIFSCGIGVYTEKVVPDDLFYVSSNQPITIDEINALESNSYVVSFEEAKDVLVSAYSGVKMYANLIATNVSLPNVTDMAISYGEFFSQEQEDKSEQVIVLNENAAFELFGSVDPIGATLDVEGVTYKVVGVVADNIFTKSKLYMYVPFTTCQNFESISSLSIRSNKPEYEITTDFTDLGFVSDYYTIFDIDKIVSSISQSLKIFIFYFSLLGLLLLLSTEIKSVKSIVRIVKQFMKNSYIRNFYVLFKDKIFVAKILKIIGLLVLDCLIVNIGFFTPIYYKTLYMNASMLPKNLLILWIVTLILLCIGTIAFGRIFYKALLYVFKDNR